MIYRANVAGAPLPDTVVTDSGETLGQTKERLVRAAARMFSEQGYARTSLRELVDAAGLTKGAFYHYFSNKEEILILIYNSYLDDQVARLKVVAACRQPATETLYGVIHAMLQTVAVYPDRITIFQSERAALSEAHVAAVRAKREEFQRIIIDVIERGVRERVFRATADVRLTAYAIIGMCTWGNEWYDADGRNSIEEISRLYTDLALGGLLRA